jgi:hypothetical protein
LTPPGAVVGSSEPWIHLETPETVCALAPVTLAR